ncbi:hypothetical protein H5410_053608 [Solanum commersonii]|uniref:Uncharacterized protein n=1 Tax=Solanum commersonii TaxID=4109 RepID=A0A9J5X6C9_SOLCO|nr:hypothetical protein H5410_053608 [Solanum commersonii]
MNVEYDPAFPRIFTTFGRPGGPGAGAEATIVGNTGAGGEEIAGGIGAIAAASLLMKGQKTAGEMKQIPFYTPFIGLEPEISS